MKEITDKTNITGTILVEFYASWCGKCQKGLENLAAFEAETGTSTGKCDFQRNPKLLNQFITNVLFVNGKPQKKVVGLCDLKGEFKIDCNNRP